MAFPTTSILDNFNRAPAGSPPYLGSNYSGGLTISSNQVVTTNSSTDVGAVWNVSTFGPDCEVYVDITAMPTSGGAFLCLRSDITYNNSYLVEVVPTFVVVGKLVSGSFTQIGSNINVTFSAGDSFGASMIGNTITVYRKTSGSWASIGSVTDSTYTSAGYIALGIDTDASVILDNFGGGTYASSANWLKEGYWWNNPYTGRNQYWRPRESSIFRPKRGADPGFWRKAA